MKEFSKLLILFLLVSSFSNNAIANSVYGPFPITLQGYTGDKTNSVKYTGQMARHILHDSLKSIVKTGDVEKMMAYYNGEEKLQILAPKSKDDFVIKQTMVSDVGSGNLSGKMYKGAIPGWGNLTGPEVIEHMINKAGEVSGGFDPDTGFDYTQLISKFAMGAVFYNQAANNYLGKKMEIGTKTFLKPYKEGAYYTGKEHSWDEAFGYWGSAAHGLSLTAEQSYNVTKRKDMASADYNSDGVVDLYNEYTFAHAYYASSYDKGGKTNYLATINQAFIDGRKIIADANGRNLNFDERTKLLNQRDIIRDNWQKVIAESVFKYAGSTYKDIVALETIIKANGDTSDAFRTYAKHWGELKGFALALQCGPENLGETAVKLNRMMGLGPVLLNASQVVGIDSNGNFIKDQAQDWNEFKLHMLKIQKLMVDEFGVIAKSKDQLSEMTALAGSMGNSDSAEND
ncbi:MAG: hypothetical protein CFH21_00727 [Alphaproteobacteria bacterium MarineAlpha5_Bin11]|nr:MAG: hypothetical protein CFH21_00727 [Alphaproteobacteria bacterium MarineAlpha5_Bin11]